MKKINIFLITIFISISNVVAQNPYQPLSSFGNDTVAYFQYNFKENKSYYVGKKVSELLNDIEMPVVYFSLGSSPNGLDSANRVCFSTRSADETRTIIKNSQKPEETLFLLYVKFGPKIKFPIPKEDFLYKNSQDTLTQGDFVNFSTYVIEDMYLSQYIKYVSPVITPSSAPTEVPIVDAERAVQQVVTDKFNMFDLANQRVMNTDNDTVYLSDLYDLAENSFQNYSIVMTEINELFKEYYTYPAIKDSLYLGGSILSTINQQFVNPTATFHTNPKSVTGSYKFTGPMGMNLLALIKGMKAYLAGQTNRLYASYVIAHDGSAYALYVADKSLLKNTNLYLNSSYLYTQDDPANLKWGFLKGSISGEEFLDVFRRLYNEGYGFSKEDTYNAALAYVLEGHGIMLFKKDSGSSVFKYYRTTANRDASGKIVGYTPVRWQ